MLSMRATFHHVRM
ncbi:hypothetical protein E2C01_066273 [Portunus trituberculatus]|uniref:Uncharacterized protein n=1 Tax=Portunus trituberculatus TaxID=210409 RepID=A0A5B7HGN5_PORTR|nr:hypothetical protein [Portunus trituberculatus]